MDPLNDAPNLRVVAAQERIKALNPIVNSVLSTFVAKGESDPKMFDLLRLKDAPVLVKDCIDVAGQPTGHGSRIFDKAPPESDDAEVVRRLKGAGMVIVGKAHLTEFCFGATGENAHHGDCLNPWDQSRITGGSSSGSAAAVAAGMVRFAIGTDTGGSVRVPAALCGVVGLRPTMGIVSNSGVLDVSTICDTVGPFAPTVSDAAELFSAIAGYDQTDPASIPSMGGDPRARIGRPLKGMRIALPRTFFYDDLQEEVTAALEEAARTYERLGARLVEVDLADPDGLREHRTFNFVLADVADARRELSARYGDRIGPEVLRRIELGQKVMGQDYAACIRALWRWKAELRAIFADTADVILTPTTPVTAPLWEDSRNMVETTKLVARMTYDLGAAGIPSLSVPCGFDRKGLPIGMQLSAAWGREDLLFQFGDAFQQETDFHNRRPAGFPNWFE